MNDPFNNIYIKVDVINDLSNDNISQKQITLKKNVIEEYHPTVKTNSEINKIVENEPFENKIDEIISCNRKLSKILPSDNNSIDVFKKVLDELENENIKKVFKSLLSNEIFLSVLKDRIGNITKDNKLDFNDVPDLIYIIMNSYNILSDIKLSEEEIPDFIKAVINYIMTKYDLAKNSNIESIENAIVIGIKLVLLQPKVTNILKKYLCCK